MTQDVTGPLEIERYEMAEGPAYRFALGRREFLTMIGKGILVGLVLPPALAQETGQRRRRSGGEPAPQDLGAWLHIAEDGAVTVYTGKVEVGQDIRTSLAQVVAEELRMPLAAVQLVMGDTDLTPFDMGTFGSRTTPTMGVQLRRVAAVARELLVDLAAEQWKVDRGSVVVAGGRVSHPSTARTVDFGHLTRGQKLVRTVTDAAPTTPAANWTVAGTSAPKTGCRDFVTGRHQYTSDLARPGMLYGKVLRPPAFQAALTSLKTAEAEAIPGVKAVHDGSFVGVIAPDSYTASLAVSALQAEWKTTPQPSAKELFDLLKKGADSNQDGAHLVGSMDEGLAAADRKLQATYTIAYIAHAPLEPRAAVAEWKGGKLTVWTGTQRPFGVRGELAEAFGIPQEQVRVIVPDTGSGYGGKHTGECAIEAARLAKASGRPVKLVWTREEEFTWAYFRPAGLIEVSSGVKNDGTLTAWEFHNYNSGSSGIGTPYESSHQRIQFHQSPSPLRQGSYRGLAATANHFARESHMDDLAHSLGMDPLEFRLHNLKDDRLRSVLDAAAKQFGWGHHKAAPGHGFGIAGGNEKGSYVASCAEVATNPAGGPFRVVRLVTAFECGAIINPDHLKSQIEGAALMGLGGALFEAIDFDNGKILNPHFSQYRVPRFGDMPVVEAVLVDRKDLPSAGAGETPIVAIAPAIGNALFSATGRRVRSLPMQKS